jgi:hypothetical protein
MITNSGTLLKGLRLGTSQSDMKRKIKHKPAGNRSPAGSRNHRATVWSPSSFSMVETRISDL